VRKSPWLGDPSYPSLACFLNGSKLERALTPLYIGRVIFSFRTVVDMAKAVTPRYLAISMACSFNCGLDHLPIAAPRFLFRLPAVKACARVYQPSPSCQISPGPFQCCSTALCILNHHAYDLTDYIWLSIITSPCLSERSGPIIRAGELANLLPASWLPQKHADGPRRLRACDELSPFCGGTSERSGPSRSSRRFRAKGHRVSRALASLPAYIR
jgi:hypothetical protein